MSSNLFQTNEYRDIMKNHIERTIEYFFSQAKEFAIVCEVEEITFNPELPESIKSDFNKSVLFVLSGYTFETAKIENGYFYFEAGFGEMNFGSTIEVPLLAIKQIFIDEMPILINMSTPEEKRTISAKNSMEVLLNNPKNKKLLRKKKL